jgi:hypothetical protein
MLTSILKFVHMLFVLTLLGSTFYAVVLVTSRKFVIAKTHQHARLQRVHQIMLLSLTFALVTGTLLVYPKELTFRTYWIQAAYGLSAVFAGGVILLSLFQQHKLTDKRWTWAIFYFLLGAVLVGSIHGAVTKSFLNF